MTKKETKGRASYAGALLICRNLAQLTAYEMVGDQIMMPDNGGSQTSISQSLILMPGVRLASDEMARGIAKLGTTAIGVRCLHSPDAQRVADFTVLFVANGNAERFAAMRAWIDQDGGLYLIPDEDTAKAGDTCFKFDRGLRKATRPWTDDADRQRGLAEAMVLLLAEGADQRPS
ncbi:hypothetical protein WJT74_06550 [Sphingomicrobium sp. XHP0239]|uniref:hypothetical protein n=1 Tax=Sphingomicrobium maritimum TaxID=3133972 RepID=UPI0031CC82A0